MIDRQIGKDAALNTPVTALTNRDIDGARCAIGELKLQVRLGYRINAKRWDFGIDAAGFNVLRVYNARLDALNREQEFREFSRHRQ